MDLLGKKGINLMSEINTPRDVKNALKAIDIELLDQLIRQSLREERTYPLQTLQLYRCGSYVARELSNFENAVSAHGRAKSTKKREETGYSARKAGDNLSFAVSQMKSRVDVEEVDALLFGIDEQILWPLHFSERLTVRVCYHWRQSVEDDWSYSSITLLHNADLRPGYLSPHPARKLSAAKQEQNRQSELSHEWEHLKSLGLQSVQQYFREGRDGALIPDSYQTTTGRLNNFSADFWRDSL